MTATVRRSPSCAAADFVDMAQHVVGIFIDAKRARLAELLGAVAAAEQADAVSMPPLVAIAHDMPAFVSQTSNSRAPGSGRMRLAGR